MFTDDIIPIVTYWTVLKCILGIYKMPYIGAKHCVDAHYVVNGTYVFGINPAHTTHSNRLESRKNKVFVSTILKTHQHHFLKK